ncbi:MAG: rod shape-determining protein MreD [Rikenellaceae bacterium]
MHKILTYAGLFVVVVLLQILLFNNLGLSVMLSPLVYIVFILLLPLESTRLLLLAMGLLIGLVMDFGSGQAGINTIASMFIAFARPYILSAAVNKEVLSGAGIPSDIRLGGAGYWKYLITFVVLFNLVYFAFETLSLAHPMLFVGRFVVSTLVGGLFVWLIARAYVLMISRKG